MLLDQSKSVQTDLKSSFYSRPVIRSRFNFELKDVFLTVIYKKF